ncbi:alpha-hydroxy-acid oxidizing protein [Arthrobacter sp. NPDC080031]|uniref:alpha-hydroxy-acid oxidizing protein n=1 Tax=Arthrobacter sp. NPDC080031 TaxID=3155918 RepID=UPI00344CFCA4
MNRPPQYGDFQYEIYLDGLKGIAPRYPVDFASLEEKAHAVMPWWVRNYVAAGCGNEHTQRANVEAFNRWGLVPRMFNGSYERDLSVSLFGVNLPSPIFMSPIGVIGLCSQDFHGDLRVAEAAAATGVPMMTSTLSMDPMEEIAQHLGQTPGFFQLYTPGDRDLAESLINRAQGAGFKAIALTLDTWVTGWRPRDLNYASFPQLRGYCLSNYFTDPYFRKRLEKSPEEDPAAAAREWMKVFGNSLTWDDLKWIREVSHVPLIAKGICHPEDARKAIDLGVDAIYCSNHGGRQANGGLSALEMLGGVVEAADGVPVLFDSGVRNGSDVVKALALGATAVGIGRPYAYALAVGGTDGVIQQLRSILAEADLLMAVDGYPTIADLRKGGLIKAV